MFIHPFDTNLKTLSLFLSQHEDFIWLDSVLGDGFSVLAFDAGEEVSFTPDSTSKDFLSFLDSTTSFQNRQQAFSFEGGWIGYLTYEAFLFSDLIPFRPKFFKTYPLAKFYRYETFLVIQDNQLFFVSLSKDAEKKWRGFWGKYCVWLKESQGNFLKKVGASPRACPKSEGNYGELPLQKYAKDFSKIKQALSRGDYFELNYTINHSFSCNLVPIEFYHDLRKTCPAPMMAFLNFDEVKILSASPESFFRIQNQKITTEPIKGTIARSNKNDLATQKKLKESEKERAELLMVTDLLRNDLGRICRPGSIVVEKLFELKSFTHYHHLVSTISGHLQKFLKMSDVFQAIFPGGSVTGAPKIKVMEHIQELEQRPRGVYTGAIGYLSHNGNVHFNIPIRTVTFQNHYELATGGGIVIDSVCEKEYEECQVKIKGILETLKDPLKNFGALGGARGTT